MIACVRVHRSERCIQEQSCRMDENVIFRRKKTKKHRQFPVVFLFLTTSSAPSLLLATVSLYWRRDFLIPLKFMKSTDVMFLYYIYFRLDLYPLALYDVVVYYSFIGLQIFLTLIYLPELFQW